MRALFAILILLATLPCLAQNTIVRVDTPLGHFDIELLEDTAPGTTENFLNYVRDGDFENTFIHRSERRFVIQGGGFGFVDGEVEDVETDAAIDNEFGRSNLRGTVAMARVAGEPNSAQSQWFVNVDNNDFLDGTDGGFTVFGQVLGDGMNVVDQINSIITFNAGGALAQLPLINYAGGQLQAGELITTTLSELSAFETGPWMSGTWANPATLGQGWLIDVFDNNGAMTAFAAWFTYDVNDPLADETDGFASNQHRWITAFGPVQGSVANLTLFLDSGGVFNDPRSTETSEIGSLMIDFSDCDNATLSWNFSNDMLPDASVALERITADSYCERSQAGGDLPAP